MQEATNSSLWSITRRSQPYDMYQGKGEPYHHASIRKRIALNLIITLRPVSPHTSWLYPVRCVVAISIAVVSWIPKRCEYPPFLG